MEIIGMKMVSKAMQMNAITYRDVLIKKKIQF